MGLIAKTEVHTELPRMGRLTRPYPQYGWDFPQGIPEKFGKTLETLSGLLGLFRHFLDTPAGEAQEALFETFWGFRGSGVWRLLYMGLAIVSIAMPYSAMGGYSGWAARVYFKTHREFPA